MPNVREKVGVEDAVAVHVNAKPTQTPNLSPGVICLACGQVLEASGWSQGGKPLPASRDDKALPCEDAGPHKAQKVDMATAVFDRNGRVLRAVHLDD